MDFDFSGEQKAIRDEARRVLNAQCDFKRVREVLEGRAPYDGPLWLTIAEMGWLGAAVPESEGGLGLGQVTLCVIAEELGRALAPLPVASSIYLAADVLLRAGTDAQKQRWIPKLVAGTAIGTVALAQGLRSMTSAPKTLHFENGRLRGSQLPVQDGGIADFAIVHATTTAGSALVLVDLNQTGVRKEALETIDPTRPAVTLIFEQAIAESLHGEAITTIRDLLDSASVFVAFEQIGGAQRALEISCDYARMRYAFGRPIGSFQAIKHKLADMFTRIELARANAFHAAWALETRSSELPLAASAARLAATDAFEFAARETIQVHGGLGATWEADMHLFYRRSKQLMALLDTPPVWRNRLVAHLEAQFTN